MVKLDALKRQIRTWQTYFPALQETKFDMMQALNRLLRRPADPDFGVLRFLTPKDGEVFLDVGANRGQSIGSMRLYHPVQRIVAFEPNAFLANRLAKRLGPDHGVDLRNCGLSDMALEAPLYVPFYRDWMFDGLASFDRGAAESWLNEETISGFNPALQKIETITCVLQKLDDLSLNPVFMKIDVQGFEPQVLRGGEETLKRSMPIMMIEDAFDLVDWMAERGFEAYEFEGLKMKNLTKPTQNVFFVSKAMRSRLEQGGLSFS